MKRRLPLIFVAVVTVTCLVAASVAAVAAGVGGSPVAYQVNSTKVSQADFDGELREIADHPKAMKTLLGVPVASTNGAITAEATISWLNIKIPLALIQQAAARRKITPGAAERKRGEQALSSALKQANVDPAIVPPTVHRELVDFFSYELALKFSNSTAAQAFISKAARNGHISVDPRYGSFGPRGLCPPAGCPASSSTGG
jgi:hypothetical protein